MIHWREPLWLLTLLMVPAAIVLLLVATTQAHRAAKIFAGGEETPPPDRWLLRAILIPPTLGLIAFALADPLWGRDVDDVERTGVDIVFVLDLSRSMLAGDAPPSRLERAKREIRGLLELLGDDRIALVTFAGRSELACPLTDDQHVFQFILDYSDTQSIPSGGSNLASAFDLAVEAFDERSVGKAVVVLTDGEFQGTDPSLVLGPLERARVPLYVIGVGTDSGAKIPIELPSGELRFLTDSAGQEVVTRMNRDLLSQLAQKSGGAFLATQDSAFPMDEMYQKRIRFLTSAAYASAQVSQAPSRYQIPLFLAFAMLQILWFPTRRWKRGTGYAGRVIAASLVILLAGAWTWSAFAQQPASSPPTADAPAVDASELERVERAARRHPHDARYLYNWGTRLHQAGRNDQAAGILQDAGDLAASKRRGDASLVRDALYNSGNSYYRGSENAPADKKRAALESARDAYAQALMADPSDGEARHNLALTLQQLRQNSGGGGESDNEDKQQQGQGEQPQTDSQAGQDEQDPNSGQNEDPQQPKPNPQQQEQSMSNQETEQALDQAEAMQRSIDQFKEGRRRQGGSKDW